MLTRDVRELSCLVMALHAQYAGPGECSCDFPHPACQLRPRHELPRWCEVAPRLQAGVPDTPDGGIVRGDAELRAHHSP